MFTKEEEKRRRNLTIIWHSFHALNFNFFASIIGGGD